MLSKSRFNVSKCSLYVGIHVWIIRSRREHLNLPNSGSVCKNMLYSTTKSRRFHLYISKFLNSAISKSSIACLSNLI